MGAGGASPGATQSCYLAAVGGLCASKHFEIKAEENVLQIYSFQLKGYLKGFVFFKGSYVKLSTEKDEELIHQISCIRVERKNNREKTRQHCNSLRLQKERKINVIRI